MNKPALIVGELSNERQDPDQLGIFQAELQQVERQLKTVDHQQHQLLQLAVKGFPEGQVEAENTRLNKARETLQAHKGELERQIKTRQTAVINMPKLEHTIELLQQRLKDPDFATKRDFMVKMWTSPRSPESGNGLGRSLKDVRVQTG